MAIRRLATRDKSRSWATAGRAGIIVCQHILLWTALYIAASTMYTLIQGAISVKDIPTAVLLLVSSIVSVFYVALHCTITRLHTSARNLTQCERVDTLRSLATFTLRIMATLWLITAAISITVTTSRRPLCQLSGTSSKLSDVMPLDQGTMCILNRVAILSSFVALLTSGMMFILMDKVTEPFRCHLFGIVEEHRLLPLFLPHHKTAKLAMRSEMSFKCRSSTSIESEAIAPPRSSSASMAVAPRTSSANLLPPNPRNALGLGIYTSKTCLPPSILTPWPSMTTIRAAYLAPPPPSSPLPPVPAYVPYRYQSPSTPLSAAPPPQRPARPTRTRSFMVAPITKPESALTKRHLAALHRDDSFSSIYSRSTSGGSLPALSESGSRSLSPSSSSSTLGGTPLKSMVSAPEEEELLVPKRLSSWEVDDDAELDARNTPVVRYSARAGVMKHVRDTWVESPNLANRESPQLPIRAKSLSPPRKIRKTRESGREHNMF